MRLKAEFTPGEIKRAEAARWCREQQAVIRNDERIIELAVNKFKLVEDSIRPAFKGFRQDVNRILRIWDYLALLNRG